MSSSLQARLDGLVREHDVPGATAAVFANGETATAASGVVNRRTGVEATVDSPFMIQSITKAWTATLVMQLVDEGLVGLDDPVRRHLPSFRTADQQTSDTITIRHLLTHTGGFEGDLWPETTDGDDALALFVDEHVARAAQHLPPGEVWSYCSAGFGVLGRLVEVLRGTTYARALRRHLTDPLRLDGIVADAGEGLAHRTAIGHVSRDGVLAPMRTWAVMPASNPAAGNQLAMPVTSLLALGRLALADGRAPDGTQLITPDSVRLMCEPHVVCRPSIGPPGHQGLGWQVKPAAGLVEHSGGTIGAGSLLRIHPESGVAVAVLTNGGGMGGLIADLCDELFADLAGVTPDPDPATPPKPGVEDPRRYVGRYELHNFTVEVSTDGPALVALAHGRNEAADMDERAGYHEEPVAQELRRFDGETFVAVEDGEIRGAVEFLGSDDAGRARFLHRGRAIPRVE